MSDLGVSRLEQDHSLGLVEGQRTQTPGPVRGLDRGGDHPFARLDQGQATTSQTDQIEARRFRRGGEFDRAADHPVLKAKGPPPGQPVAAKRHRGHGLTTGQVGQIGVPRLCIGGPGHRDTGQQMPGQWPGRGALP